MTNKEKYSLKNSKKCVKKRNNDYDQNINYILKYKNNSNNILFIMNNK